MTSISYSLNYIDPIELYILKVGPSLSHYEYASSPSRHSTLYIIRRFCEAYSEMSSVVSQAEASKPQQQNQKKMQECFKCKAAGYPNQLIGFEKVGENPTTGKGIWKLIDENGSEHKHKYLQDLSKEQLQQGQQQLYQNEDNNKTNAITVNRPIFRRRRVADIATVTDVEEARKLLIQGWDFQASYPATIANIPHYILVRRE
jgi:hypothetical protein